MRGILIYTQPTSNRVPNEHPFQPPERTMIVCVCRRVSDREIVRHARAGMDFDDIQFELGVATQCGQCEGCARDIVAQCSATSPVAAIQLASSITEGKSWTSQQVSRRA